jgi:phage terminase small subunit
MTHNPRSKQSAKARQETEPEKQNEAPAPSDTAACAPTGAVPSSLLECPPELPSVARDEWHRIVVELIALGLLSKFDRIPLAIYCGSYARYLESLDAIEKYGTMMKIAERISRAVALRTHHEPPSRHYVANRG